MKKISPTVNIGDWKNANLTSDAYTTNDENEDAVFLD